jgi:hypothetical protein
MTLHTRKQLMMGMPRTGKSTFIGALFHVVESGQIPDSLQLIKMERSRGYVVESRERWIGGNEFERSKLGEDQVVTMKLRDPATGDETELILPDVSGETFREQWEQRKSSKLFDEFARQSDGILFFIHPDTIKSPVRIQIAKKVADQIGRSKKLASKPAAQISREWKHEFAPTQTKLVELLQFLTRDPDIYPISRVAVIVSAWDLVEDQYQSPRMWLEKRVPLFSQFLKANQDRFAWTLYGLSALGGNLDEDKLSLLKAKRQAERIRIIGDGCNLHDITAPIKWLMNSA